MATRNQRRAKAKAKREAILLHLAKAQAAENRKAAIAATGKAVTIRHCQDHLGRIKAEIVPASAGNYGPSSVELVKTKAGQAGKGRIANARPNTNGINPLSAREAASKARQARKREFGDAKVSLK